MQDEPFRVGFFVAGVQKGGTSSLDAYLRQHPQIGMAARKEPHFFDRDSRFSSGPPPYGEYHGEFVRLPSHRIYGEATPIYTYWAEALSRLWRYNPRGKLIVLLRDPLQRAWSHWRMMNSQGKETGSFGEALRQESARHRTARPRQSRHFSYVDRGFYSEQIRRARRLFDPEQLCFIKSERFFREPTEVMREIGRFLGVDEFVFDVSEAYRRGKPAPPIPPEDKAYLQCRFAHEVRCVESLLNWDCSDWLA